MLHTENKSSCDMDLSAAYGTGYFAAPLGAAEDQTPTDTPPEPLDDIPPTVELTKHNKHSRSSRSGDVYMIHLEIGRDDVHILCMFIAALILSLLFSSRR